MDSFSEPVRRWFEQTYPAPTRVQREGWPVLVRGRNALLVAPTGSGKTLAAFLWAIDRLSFGPGQDSGDRTGQDLGDGDGDRAGDCAGDAVPREAEGAAAKDRTAGVRVLYVSPLKALVHDIERNLREPLAGVRRAARKVGRPVRPITVDVRTGDTTPYERRRQLRRPGEILVTTPESLFLILGSRAAANLRTVETVIVDEVHAMAATKRGAHLALSLERLAELTGNRAPQRIGLSATVRPLALAAEFLGGDRPVEIVDASEPPHIDLEVVVPVADMEAPPRAEAIVGSGDPPPGTETAGLWPSVYPRILEAVRSHRSTIVFVNSRSLCERLAQRLNDLAVGIGADTGGADGGDGDTGGAQSPSAAFSRNTAQNAEPLVRAHHGSVSHEQRREIEESLKAGRLRCLVATSSLELGIDMGSVDLVLMVEAPGSAVRGLQRVGRAGHAVGERSRGLMFPRFRGDLLECTVTAIRMQRGAIEKMRLPENPLDVLAQQVVAMCCDRERTVDELLDLARRARPWRGLTRSMLTTVLHMLVGRYPSEEFADLRPRLSWDHGRDVLTARRGAALLVRMNAGTIPDRGLFTVHLGPDGPRLGELDEEMVYESRAGDTFLLGAAAWRVTEITRDRVIVRPAPGEPGRMPFWHGDGPGRPVELGKALGAFVRELGRRDADDAHRHLAEEAPLDRHAAANLFAYVDEQRKQTGTLPTDRALTIERFRDEIGDWRVCILTPFGARIHAPWAMALERRFGEHTGVRTQIHWTDDGIALRFADADSLPPARQFLLDPSEVEDMVTDQVASTPMFASRFRENAARALLLPRNRPGRRTPLWQQRQRSRNLLSVARRYPDFPVLLETYRECMSDLFDLPGLVDLMSRIEHGVVRVDDVETPGPSPFARSLVFAYQERFLYEDDAPAAERRAQALTLDRELLRELLGTSSMKELLDQEVIQAVDLELQGLATGRGPRHEDDLHDLLRRTGGLTRAEVAARAADDADNADEWLTALERQKRALEIALGDGRRFWVAVEDAAFYRDGLGTDLPDGLPRDLLATRAGPLGALVRRFARSRGPFRSIDVAGRYGLPQGAVEPLLEALEDDGSLVRGEFRSGADGAVGVEWCHREVLRQIKRRTLARLRREAEPVDGAALARFLGQWQGVARRVVARGIEQEAAAASLSPPRGLFRTASAASSTASAVSDLAVSDGAVSGRGVSGRGIFGRAVSDRALGRLEDTVSRLEGLPLSWRTLVDDILPARIPGFQVEMLDRLASTGEWLWVGRGRLGPRDGRVAVYGRDRFRVLARGVLARGPAEQDAAVAAGGSANAGNQDAESAAAGTGGRTARPETRPEESTDGRGDRRTEAWTEGLHQAILKRLETRGACFTFDLVRGVVGAGDWGETEVEAAIWDLVWAGRITNDTFLPLESLSKRRKTPSSMRPRRGPPRGLSGGFSGGWPRRTGRVRSTAGLRRSRAATLAGGRWSLVACVAAPDTEISDTEWAHATANLLLDRYGVVSAETARAENVPGGFEALFPVLREMEGVGHLRRGYFVHGLAGRQFARPVAVERLRRTRRAREPEPVELLPAIDPANPWGAVLPWPRLASAAEPGGSESGRSGPGRAGPRRLPRAWLVLRAGTPCLYLEAGGRGVWSFSALGGDPDPREAWYALRDLAGRRKRRSIRLLRIDGRPAAESRWAPTLEACGFEKEPHGYRVSRLLPAP